MEHTIPDDLSQRLISAMSAAAAPDFLKAMIEVANNPTGDYPVTVDHAEANDPEAETSIIVSDRAVWLCFTTVGNPTVYHHYALDKQALTLSETKTLDESFPEGFNLSYDLEDLTTAFAVESFLDWATGRA